MFCFAKINRVVFCVQRSLRKLVGAFGVVFVLSALAAPVYAAKLFRYVDENGVTVLSHTIANDRVQYGYDIVDGHSNLIERVPAQLSEEAYQLSLAQKSAHQQCLKMLQRVQNLYQTEADIDRALAKGLSSIDLNIQNIRANLQAIEAQREDFEAAAAQLDVQGKRIPNSLLDNIERAKGQENNFAEEIKKRLADKRQLRKTNAYDRLVFVKGNCKDNLPPKP